ncbi:hypothetical protein [Devosia sp. 2618]|uniref:hypothetical protein n=1 Tax=Devosia sp. 2618 TaxID=3156454 RepID=UPI0033939A72
MRFTIAVALTLISALLFYTVYSQPQWNPISTMILGLLGGFAGWGAIEFYKPKANTPTNEES